MYARSFFIAMLVTFFVTNFSFGACTYYAERNSFGQYQTTQTCNNNTGAWCGLTCTDLCASISVSSSVKNGRNLYVNCVPSPNQQDCGYSGSTSNCNKVGYFQICSGYYRCANTTEVDSLACEQEGGQWNGTSCIQGDTTSCETYKKECDSMGGKFEGRPLGNTCSATCDVCNSNALKIIKKAWDVGCCNQQLTPPDSVENQICITPFQSGEGMTLSTGCLQQDNCNCGVPLTENLEFDYGVYSQKCGSAEGGQDPNSSASEGGLSSSSSASDSSSVPPQVQVLGLEGLMDSLHKIIYNTAEVDTTTTFMLMCMQNPELYCPSLLGSSSSGDTIIIEGDTTIVNVPSDSAIIAEVSENIKNQGARTRIKLDSMTKELLDSMSQSDSAYRAFDSSANFHRDSLLGIIGAMQIVEGNETQALLDSIKGKLEGVVGELAGFGDKLDSLELNLPDTTLDLGGSDTTTIRGTIDSLGTWVGSLVSPDSAGGWGSQNSDGSYGDGSGYGFGIKKGANDSLGSQLGGVIGGMVDTGAVADILDTMQKWQDAFNFGASASTGGCPSILTRQYQINIAGASFSVPPIGQYLCSPIAGFNTTMWDIGRMVVRALVSIMCFLWLFKICMTEGKGDD